LFFAFAGIAAAAAILFITLLPETGSGPCPRGPGDDDTEGRGEEA
jgi:hypothetical protein